MKVYHNILKCKHIAVHFGANQDWFVFGNTAYCERCGRRRPITNIIVRELGIKAAVKASMKASKAAARRSKVMKAPKKRAFTTPKRKK